MNKISKRLKSVASFIKPDDKALDVGCDHGLLSIYLYQNKLCQNIIATDINSNALNNAIKNINLLNIPIKTYISDGIKDIPLDLFDTIIISGMGASTILHILEDEQKLIHTKKIILQSNNDHSLLRKSLNLKGYYLSDENVVFEKGKYYVTMLFIKNKKVNNKNEIKYGLLKESKKDYFEHLIITNKKILTKIPKTKFLLKLKLRKKNIDLKKQYKKIK